MDREKLLKISKDVENTPNKDLIESLDLLNKEFDKTKDIIIDLTRHLDVVENLHKKITAEIKKRSKPQ